MSPPRPRKNRKGRRNRNVQTQILDRPLPFDCLPVVHNFKVRYQWTSNNSISTTLTPSQLISSWFTCFETSAEVLSIVNAVRFRHTELWCGSGGGSIFTPNTAALGWQAETTFGRDVLRQDMSITASQAAHVKLLPIKGTSSAEWQTTQSSQPWTMILAGSIGAILDICCDVLLNASPLSSTANNFKSVTNTPVAGAVYFTNLITTAGTGSLVLVPQGVLNIT